MTNSFNEFLKNSSDILKKNTVGVASFDLLIKPFKEETLPIGLRDLHAIILKDNPSKIYTAINLDYGIHIISDNIFSSFELLIKSIWDSYSKYVSGNDDSFERIKFEYYSDYWDIFNEWVNIGRKIEQEKSKIYIQKNDRLREMFNASLVECPANFDYIVNSENKNIMFKEIKPESDQIFLKKGFLLYDKNQLIA